MVLLRRGHNHPRRLLRFSNLGFFIPQLLAEDCERFVSEQQRYGDIRRSIGAARAELDELLRAEARAAALAKAAANVEEAAAEGEGEEDSEGQLPSAFQAGPAVQQSRAGGRTPPNNATRNAEDRSSASQVRRGAGTAPGVNQVASPSAHPQYARSQSLEREKLPDIQEQASAGKLPSVISGPATAPVPPKRRSNQGDRSSVPEPGSARSLLSAPRQPWGRVNSMQVRDAGAGKAPSGGVNRQLSMPTSHRRDIQQQQQQHGDSHNGAGRPPKAPSSTRGVPADSVVHQPTTSRGVLEAHGSGELISQPAYRQARMNELRQEHDRLVRAICCSVRDLLRCLKWPYLGLNTTTCIRDRSMRT